ncbi:LamG-like jellyroll fold domain-containing protein [Parasphingorhabdus sp.]|uniref:LamG-like jellyroll fold domain-containing protein n=1 Tax=Parasphingorhabdus sp. TaxID=2709688 RepID=UPI003296BC75
MDIDPEDPRQRRVEVYVVYRVPVGEGPEILDLPKGLVLTRHGTGTSLFDTPLLFDLDTSDPNGATLPLDLYGTIEFWVRPAEALASDNENIPVLLALHGEEQVKLSIQMPRENDRLIIWDGTNETGLADVAYAFTKDIARHVALATLKGRSSLYIDGRHKGTFGTGYGAGLAGQLVVGALNADNELAFDGDIGSVRLWRRALEPNEIAKLPETTGQPSPSSPVYDDLIAHASRDGTSLLVPDRAIRLDLSAWKLFGSDNFSVRNKAAYTTSAIFSDHQRDAADTSADPDVRSEYIAFLKQHMNDPERAFSSYPLYIFRQVPADRFGFAATPVPGFSGAKARSTSRSSNPRILPTS